MALGAFLAGLVVGRSDYGLRAASEALPMRDAFAVLFFVAVGMLLEPRYLLEAPALIAAALAVVMIGKPLVALAIVRMLGYPFTVALGIAVALAQIGEFSFMLSGIGTDLGILPTEATNTLVAVSIISIVLNPLLYRVVPHVERFAMARPRVWKFAQPTDQTRPRSPIFQAARRRRHRRWPDRPHGDASASRQRDRADGDQLNIDTVRRLRMKAWPSMGTPPAGTFEAAGVSSRQLD